jgi:diphosphomevalonate decarboxylase
MTTLEAVAIAHPNIAFIKYWGNRDDSLRLPSNGSISMNLAGIQTWTSVRFDPTLEHDSLIINGQRIEGKALDRVALFLDAVRKLAEKTMHADVVSVNNYPTGAGVASSAAAFAALGLAASTAIGLQLSPADLSRLARLGSGSACRSIPGGFVEWNAGTQDINSYAVSIVPANHWDLLDCIAIVQAAHKSVGSSEGHKLAGSSPLQAARVADAPRRLDICRQAILARDFNAFAEVTELDSTLMHAVMMTSCPPLFYWQPASLEVMSIIREKRNHDGWPVCCTLDAGPNVHVLTTTDFRDRVLDLLNNLKVVDLVIPCSPGGEAFLDTGS